MYNASQLEWPLPSAGNEASPTLDVLPPPTTVRWVIRRKAQVLAAIRAGTITRQAALERYSLSDEELDSWQLASEVAGMYGLRSTRLQAYKPLFDQFRNGQLGQ